MPTPIKLTIKFKADTLGEFVEKYGTYVSQGGIFVRTRKPLAVGTLLDFEFKLQNGDALLKGMGTVVWTREHDPGRKTAPAGMGLRYDSLDSESQGILEKILSIKSENASDTDSVIEESKEVETSPGNQEEKTRVASVDVLKKLRGTDSSTESDSSDEKGPASDIFDDMDDLPSSDGKQEKAETAKESIPDEPEDSAEKPAKDSPVQTSWDDDATPIPSKIHPLISTDDSIPPEEKDETEETEEHKQEEQKNISDMETSQLPADDDIPDLDEDVSSAFDSLSAQSENEKTAVPEIPVDVKKVFDIEDDNKKIITEEVVEEKSSGSLTIMLFFILVVLAAFALYYFRFMHKDTNESQTKVSSEKNLKKTSADSMKVSSMNSEMKVDTVNGSMKPPLDMKSGDATRVEVVDMKSSDATRVDVVDMKSGDATKVDVVDMKSGDATEIRKIGIAKDVMKPDTVMPPKEATPANCGPNQHEAQVTTVPEGADVMLNLEKTGKKTPVNICLDKGKSYSFKIELDGYLAVNSYHPRVKGPLKIHKQLSQVPRQLVIQSRPKGAMVYIDGKRMGPSTIAQKYPVPQELWKIEIRMRGYEPYKTVVKKDDPKWIKKGYAYIFSVFAILKAQ
ncbi:MAG: TIGR02266 family protein [Deltaproteobacteria bacterium]|nr:TIGR02266 family protein [Deltaproteobacteria bacterium]